MQWNVSYPIWFKLGMVKDDIALYSLIWVQLILTLIRGHSGAPRIAQSFQ